MFNSRIALTIDRNNKNGFARIQGTYGNKQVDLSVKRDNPDTDAYVTGGLGTDRVNLNFNRDPYQGYNSIQGSIGGRAVNGTLTRSQPDGDTSAVLNGHRLVIDRSQQGRQVDIQSNIIDGHIDRDLREGDEHVAFNGPRASMNFEIDRDPQSGNFVIAGTNDHERFSTTCRRNPKDGDLTLEGTLPDNFELFPVLWEILGDDKNIPDKNPLYPGSLTAMSMQIKDTL